MTVMVGIMMVVVVMVLLMVMMMMVVVMVGLTMKLLLPVHAGSVGAW